MRVRVLYFGVLKDVLGVEHEVFELAAAECMVADLIARIKARGRVQPDLWRSIAVAVNQEYVSTATMLQDDDEVALLPPVSGGSGKSEIDAG